MLSFRLAGNLSVEQLPNDDRLGYAPGRRLPAQPMGLLTADTYCEVLEISHAKGVDGSSLAQWLR